MVVTRSVKMENPPRSIDLCADGFSVPRRGEVNPHIVNINEIQNHYNLIDFHLLFTLYYYLISM